MNRRTSWPHKLYAGAALTALISSVSWATSRLVDTYRGEGAATARTEERHRELDRIQNRLDAIEQYLRTDCKR